jgi:hypothetical protein
VAEDGEANDELGHSLAAHGSIIAAGANGADTPFFMSNYLPTREYMKKS